MNNQEDQDVNRLLVWLAQPPRRVELIYDPGISKPWLVVVNPGDGMSSGWHHSPREALKAAKKMIEEKQ